MMSSSEGVPRRRTPDWRETKTKTQLFKSGSAGVKTPELRLAQALGRDKVA